MIVAACPRTKTPNYAYSKANTLEVPGHLPEYDLRRTNTLGIPGYTPVLEYDQNNKGCDCRCPSKNEDTRRRFSYGKHVKYSKGYPITYPSVTLERPILWGYTGTYPMYDGVPGYLPEYDLRRANTLGTLRYLPECDGVPGYIPEYVIRRVNTLEYTRLCTRT